MRGDNERPRKVTHVVKSINEAGTQVLCLPRHDNGDRLGLMMIGTGESGADPKYVAPGLPPASLPRNSIINLTTLTRGRQWTQLPNDGQSYAIYGLCGDEGAPHSAYPARHSRAGYALLSMNYPLTSLSRRSVWALMATTIVLIAMSAAPTAGESSIPIGASTPAANGNATIL